MPPSSPYPLWGWTPGVRVLLSVFAITGGAALLFMARDAGRTPPAPLPPLVVDLNSAPPEVLRALPRLGPVLVERIVTARNEAPFRSLDDVDARVKGIGPATIRALRPHVRIAPRVRPGSPTIPPRLAATDSATP